MLESIIIACPCCGKDFDFYFDEFVTDTDVDEDRGMGEETEYVIECEEFECPKCSESMSIFGSIWEYPVGALNDTQLEITSISDDDDDENDYDEE